MKVLDFFKKAGGVLLTGVKAVGTAVSAAKGDLLAEGISEIGEWVAGKIKDGIEQHKRYTLAARALDEIAKKQDGNWFDVLYEDICTLVGNGNKSPTPKKAYAKFIYENIDCITEDTVKDFKSYQGLTVEERQSALKALQEFERLYLQALLKSLDEDKQVFVQVVAACTANRVKRDIKEFFEEVRQAFFGVTRQPLTQCPRCGAVEGLVFDDKTGLTHCSKCGHRGRGSNNRLMLTDLANQFKSSLEGKLDEISNKIDVVIKGQDDIKKGQADLKKGLDEGNKTLGEVKDTVGDIKGTVDDIKAILTGKNDEEVEQLKAQISEKETELGELKAQMESKEAELNTLKARLEEMERPIVRYDLEELKQKAENGDREAHLELCSEYHYMKKYDAAFGELLSFVERYPDCGAGHRGLAQYYEEGYVEFDPDKALKHYRIGAELDDTEAQLEIARIYRNGELVEENRTKAMQWYWKIIEKESLKTDEDVDWIIDAYYGMLDLFVLNYERENRVNLLKRFFNVWIESDFINFHGGSSLFSDLCRDIGYYYEKGEYGLEKDVDKAIKCYRRSLEVYPTAKARIALKRLGAL